MAAALQGFGWEFSSPTPGIELGAFRIKAFVLPPSHSTPLLALQECIHVMYCFLYKPFPFLPHFFSHHPPLGDIPIVKLNFIVLSLEGPFNRETVEGCIRETLLSFSRSIATKQTVEFTFKGIGVLIVRDSKVKMKFYKDFLQTMDGSGNLLKALSNVSLLFPSGLGCCLGKIITVLEGQREVI